MDTQNSLFSLFCFFLVCFFSDEQVVVEGRRLPWTSSPFAGYLGMKTPIPYRWREQLSERVKDGLNIAYGGTGVFDTMVAEPNMTTQIDFLQQLLHDSVYTKRNLKTSVAFVSVAGNDYATYNAKNGSAQDFPAFMESLMNQLMVNLKRIHDMGVRKIGITSLLPLGCLPRNTAPFSFQHCDDTYNALVALHNQLLSQVVNTLNQQTNTSNNPSFFILDLYNAFWTVFNRNETYEVSGGFKCGNVDENGENKYTLCSDPISKFFWDGVHPVENARGRRYNLPNLVKTLVFFLVLFFFQYLRGWYVVYKTPAFQNSLKQFYGLT
ncbi:hypothetical protein E1A91_A09G183400v1 [Gossypium mustelinum]|uniref:SGNH hydrolase-type esterase domain-containing protein n=1 Tax=Gossypium mustelinum TaxID=34275 RepID=A0A5D2XZH7_GOSMU|nr:hypothetical protein E1A91_A09G183400v1 [Gossypium mustelinum]